MTLDKVVAGTMGDKGKEFDFTVTFTNGDAGEKFSYAGQDYTFRDDGTVSITGIKLADETTAVQITGIPSDVKYTVVENVNQSEGYATTATVNGEEATVRSADASQTVVEQDKSKDTDAVVVTNTRNAVSPTGLATDIAPYALLVVVAVAGCFVFLRKRRED